MIDFSKFFTYNHLFTTTTEPMKYVLYFFAVFGMALLTAIYLYFASGKKPIKFQKTLYRRVADALFYLPILMILYLFIRRGGLEIASQRIIFVGLLFLWLIWLIYLLYYRLVIIKKLYLEYDKKKREERYLKNGKN